MSELLATVAITRYREPDSLVMKTLAGLARQTGASLRVLFLDQARGDDIDAALSALNTSAAITIMRIPIPAKSLSHARNLAIEMATTKTVLFIDADAIPHRTWAMELARTLRSDDSAVAVAGGRVLPTWHAPRLLLSRSRLVAEQYSVLDLGDVEREVPKVIGASFAIRTDRFSEEMHFDDRLGRSGGKLFGGEDTDLCARVRAAGGKVVYNGRAVVDHQIFPDRITYRWLMRRMFYAGYGRGIRGGPPSPSHEMTVMDWLVLPIILPAYLIGLAASRFR